MTVIAQNAQKRLNFIVVPQVRTKMREGKRESNNNNKKNTHTHTHTNMRMDKAQENTLV